MQFLEILVKGPLFDKGPLNKSKWFLKQINSKSYIILVDHSHALLNLTCQIILFVLYYIYFMHWIYSTNALI